MMLKTYSGTPYCSVEQRQHFEKIRNELAQKNPEFFYMDEEIQKMPIWRIMHWPTFKRHDNHMIGTHPLHVAWKSLEELRKVHEYRVNEINLAFTCKQIDEFMRDVFIEELTQELDRIEGQFCVKRRKEYMIKYGEQKLPTPLGIDVVNERIKGRITEYQANQPGADSVAVHDEELGRGDTAVLCE
jgi:hypothetical protein